MNFKRSLALLSCVVGTFLLSGCKPQPKTTEATVPPSVEEAPAAAPLPAPKAAQPTPAPPEKPAAAKPLRIVTWNLEWFPGKKPEATPEAEAQQMQSAKAALAELKPDVLLLQEIRDWAAAQELCSVVPGLQVHVVSRFEARPQNQVVASKLPADSGWSEVWKTEGVTPPRGFSFAALELPGPRFLLAYALHLKSNLGELSTNIALRQAATRQILTHAQEMIATYGKRGPVAVVIGGDMNTSRDDPKFATDHTLQAFIDAGFHWTHQGVPFAQRTTIPASGDFPDNCFDHLFTAGLGQPTASVKSYPAVSDHNPVVLDVDLAKADFQPRIDPAKGLALLPIAELPPPPPTVAGTIAATDDVALHTALGKVATVHGRVQNVGATANGSIHFVNFAGVPRGGFVGIVRKEHYEALSTALGGDLKTVLTGKTVSLRGELVLFKDAPQIVITAADQIQITGQ